MDTLRIEILNPKALQLINGMEDLKLIKVTEEHVDEHEEALWKGFSAQNFIAGYGKDEPEYTDADIKEPNPGYSAWKAK